MAVAEQAMTSGASDGAAPAAHSHDAPIVARGRGTGLAGQTVNAALHLVQVVAQAQGGGHA
ncbi:MAG: hypothetical protein JOZ07_04745 [Solirubrobacterales bacterium]|nr:hypothetical protein [Solirubrobacterales bacterium]